jgi:hypothetical protein
VPTEKELLALCLRWLEHPGLVHPFDKAMLVEALKAKLEPEPRPWVGLTEDEVAQAMYRADAIFTGPMQFKFAKEIEAKLKEKNT